MKKILFISGSLGLGHIARDLTIAKELRRINPEIEISWLAVHPATLLLKEQSSELHRLDIDGRKQYRQEHS